MRFSRILGYLLAVILACANHLSAQMVGGGQGGGGRTLSGSVVLQGGSQSQVRVTIESANRSFQRTLFADGAGSFSISGVPAGNYTAVLEAEGYVTRRESFEVLPGSGVQILQFILRPVAPAVAAGTKPEAVSIVSMQVPADARREYGAGQKAAEQKQWKEARKFFERALQRHAEFPEALQALALIDVVENHPESAIERLEKAVRIDGTFYPGQVTLSHVLNSVGRHAQAIEHAQKAITLRPEMWPAQYEVGFAALATGRLELAADCLRKVQELAGKEQPEARLLRAGILLKQGRNTDAATELAAFLAAAPEHPHAPLAKRILADIRKPTLE